MGQFCNMVGNGSIDLCSPLQRLKGEHKPLRAQMENLYEVSLSIEKERDTQDLNARLLQLRKGVVEFVNELDPHSEREEGVLFPMVANYIGGDVGPIAVMEYEHDQAKGNLKKFLETTNDLKDPLSKEDTIEITSLYNEAYHVLKDHFMKEEEILFPMAEQLLTEEEKKLLAQRIDEI